MRISDWSSDVCSSDLGDHLTWGAFTKFAHQPNRYFRPGEPAQHTLGGFKPRARTGLGASIALFRMRAPCYYLSITLESQAMRSEEHTSELQSLMRISYAVFCLKKKITLHNNNKRRT